MRNIAPLVFLAIVFTSIALPMAAVTTYSQATQPIYLAIVWHYHQPWYYSADESYFVLPWVRMHAVGNYYKMAYILSKYPDVKVTFTFSGSLLEQLLDMVENNKMDVRAIISWRIYNGSATPDDVFNMLRIPGGFFDINWGRILERSPRFRELRDTAQSIFRECISIATSEEMLKSCVVQRFTYGNLQHQRVIDLAVLFNLLWIDPQVAREQYPDIYELMTKAYTSPSPNFSVNDLRRVLEVQRDIMSKIVPIYSQLAKSGQIELIPVPYSHPLAPIITDLGFEEDIEIHVNESLRLFRETFGIEPKGVWPAEQAVNEQVVEAFRKAGITWTITDRDILGKAGFSVTDINNIGVPWYIDFPSGRIYVFFRDTELSNLISFQYSGWDADAAVNDFVNRVLSYASRADGPRVVVVALDGENPWEHYQEFGTLFLNKLYAKLSELQAQNKLRTITPGEFVGLFPQVAKELPIRTYTYLDLEGKDISNIPKDSYGDGYADLPRKQVSARLAEGSWSGGEVAIWIGHRQENVAWMWLVAARESVLSANGVKSMKELYARRPDIARYLLKAEASDWWWWYGGDGGGSPQTFDPLFKAYLRRAYELSGLTPPDYLLVTAYPDGTPIGWLNQVVPSPVDKAPAVDGVIEDLWANAISGGRGINITVGETLRYALVVVTPERFYMAFKLATTSYVGKAIGVYFTTPVISLSPWDPGYLIYPRGQRKLDVGIYLAREIYVDLEKKAASVNVPSNGSWAQKASVELAISEDGVVELSAKWSDIDVPQGAYTYIAIVYYEGSQALETSSRFGLVYQLQAPMGAVAGTVVLDLQDPVGDDDGAGGLGYPGNAVFKPGVFDLTRFRVIDGGDKVIFVIEFKNLGGNPWGGPNGWSMQQVHIYIRTTLSAPGKAETIALNAMLSEANAWHMAVLLAPGWGSGPLPRDQRSAIYYYDKDEPVVQDGKFKVYADQASNSIIAEISKDLLYDVDNIGKWKFVVAVTSHDGYGPNMIRPFTVGGGEWAVNVPPQYATALLNNVFPYILDLLAPTPEEQYAQLRSFDAATGKKAVLGEMAPTTTTTPTTTPVTIPTETTPTETSGAPPATTTEAAPGYPAAALAALIIIVAVVALLLWALRSRAPSAKK